MSTLYIKLFPVQHARGNKKKPLSKKVDDLPTVITHNYYICTSRNMSHPLLLPYSASNMLHVYYHDGGFFSFSFLNYIQISWEGGMAAACVLRFKQIHKNKCKF